MKRTFRCSSIFNDSRGIIVELADLHKVGTADCLLFRVRVFLATAVIDLDIDLMILIVMDGIFDCSYRI